MSDSLAQSDRCITQLVNKSTDMLRSQKGRIDVICVASMFMERSGLVLECWEHSKEPVLLCRILPSLFTLHCSSLLSGLKEYLAVDSGGYI